MLKRSRTTVATADKRRPRLLLGFIVLAFVVTMLMGGSMDPLLPASSENNRQMDTTDTDYYTWSTTAVDLAEDLVDDDEWLGSLEDLAEQTQKSSSFWGNWDWDGFWDSGDSSDSYDEQRDDVYDDDYEADDDEDEDKDEPTPTTSQWGLQWKTQSSAHNFDDDGQDDANYDDDEVDDDAGYDDDDGAPETSSLSQPNPWSFEWKAKASPHNYDDDEVDDDAGYDDDEVDDDAGYDDDDGVAAAARAKSSNQWGFQWKSSQTSQAAAVVKSETEDQVARLAPEDHGSSPKGPKQFWTFRYSTAGGDRRQRRFVRA